MRVDKFVVWAIDEDILFGGMSMKVKIHQNLVSVCCCNFFNVLNLVVFLDSLYSKQPVKVKSEQSCSEIATNNPIDINHGHNFENDCVPYGFSSI
jgi:hypothetical protein